MMSGIMRLMGDGRKNDNMGKLMRRQVARRLRWRMGEPSEGGDNGVDRGGRGEVHVDKTNLG